MRVTSSPRVKSAIVPDSSVTFLIACGVCVWRGGVGRLLINIYTYQSERTRTFICMHTYMHLHHAELGFTSLLNGFDDVKRMQERLARCGCCVGHPEREQESAVCVCVCAFVWVRVCVRVNRSRSILHVTDSYMSQMLPTEIILLHTPSDR